VSRNKRQADEVVNMDPELVKRIVARNETAFNVSIINVSDPNFPSEFSQNGKINITGNHLLITGLPHFTEYVIYVSRVLNALNIDVCFRSTLAKTSVKPTIRALLVPAGLLSERRLQVNFQKCCKLILIFS
jgi:hypothetical protein